MSATNSAPSFQAPIQVSVEIYPYEGNSIALQGGNVLGLKTTDPLRNGDEGHFEIVLTPGGPYGVTGPSWVDIITPMSLVLIGLARGNNAQIVMIGIVDGVEASTSWTNESAVQRPTTIVGRDFSYYFRSTNYYTQAILGQLAGTAIGQALGLGERAIPAELNQGLQNQTPSKIGSFYYNTVMVGSGSTTGNNGLLSKVSLPFQSQRLGLQQAISTYFETYPYARIPTQINFSFTESSWYEKFIMIFQWPWYEFYVHTLPINFLGSGMAQTSQPSTVAASQGTTNSAGVTQLQPVEVTATASPYASGYAFTMQTMPGAPPVGPTLVARVNPLPFVSITLNPQSSTTPANFNGVDTSRWNALPLYGLNYSYISTDVVFSTEEVRNFYALNPVQLRGLFGNSISDTALYFANSFGAIDPGSIARFAYRPQIQATYWLCDQQGQFAASSAAQGKDPANIIQTTVGTLLTQVFSYHEPTHLMARGNVTMELRPDIRMGCRFRYAPFKNGQTWDFYIESVSHAYTFGGKSYTTLGLTRGLPTTIYSQTASGGMLQAIHTGNAARTSGGYASGGVYGGSGLVLYNPLFTPAYAAQNAAQQQTQVTPQSQ
jgi:hypothetical protein